MKKNDDDSNKWLAHLFPLEFAHCQIATLLLYALLVLQHAVEDVNKMKTVTCSQCPKVMKLFWENSAGLAHIHWHTCVTLIQHAACNI